MLRKGATVGNIALDVRSYSHVIGCVEAKPEAYIERISPTSGRVIARFAEGTAETAAAAIAEARSAFDQGPWPRLSGQERSRVLMRAALAIRERKEELARIDSEEVGKPIRLARNDIEGVIGHFEFAAALALQVHGDAHSNLGPQYTGMVMREPVGVVGMITAWNFPALTYSQKVPYALAAGCTVVLKPSEFTSGSALEISRLLLECGVPTGALNVVTGYGSPVGEALVDSPDVDFISFTGSTATGQRIAAAAANTTKRSSLELGGKGANVVFADADLDDAIDGALFAVFFNSGQVCVSGSRLIVQDSVADEFVARLAERARQLRVGDPGDESTQLGPLIHNIQAEKVLGLIASARNEGADLVMGGERLSEGAYAGGSFIAPTIFDRVTPEMTIFRQEIFGPVLSVVRFSDESEALALANDTEYGLSNAVWTKNVDVAMRMVHGMRAGTVWVNTSTDIGPQMPYGGVGASGYGREMGRAGLDEFTELKTCLIHTGKRAPFLPFAD
jgi:betaine-aldehyde dehydrogenase